MVEEIKRIQEQIELLIQQFLVLSAKSKPEPIVAPMEEPVPLPKISNMPMWIFNIAEAHKGVDMAKKENVYGCAEAVNEIVRRATGSPIGGGASTAEMFKCLEKSEVFSRKEMNLEKASEGDIIISPSGLGIGSGHAGICGSNGRIMSNNSTSFLWDDHWTKEEWYEYYCETNNFPVFCYRYIL